MSAVATIVGYVTLGAFALLCLYVAAIGLRGALRGGERELERSRAEHYARCDQAASFTGRVLPFRGRRDGTPR